MDICTILADDKTSFFPFFFFFFRKSSLLVNSAVHDKLNHKMALKLSVAGKHSVVETQKSRVYQSRQRKAGHILGRSK